jgi:sugar lactone lactonase YvrE
MTWRISTPKLLLVAAIAAMIIASIARYLRPQPISRRGDFSRSGGHVRPANLGLSGTVVDAAGNVYVSAGNLNIVLKISPGGKVSLIAGNGDAASTGDGGPALAASLAQPMGLALDREGNLLIADMGNNRVRRVDAKTAVVSTVAGNGTMGGWIGGLAIHSGLYEPISVAVDSEGNLYIGGTTSLGIRRIDAITGLVSKTLGADLPGTPETPEPAAGPFWVASGDGRQIFFADSSRNTLSRVDTATGATQVLAGSARCGFGGDGGAAIGALLCFPEGMFLGGERLFIADTGNNRIRALDLSTGTISTVVGDGQSGYSGDGGSAASASLSGPVAVAADIQGNLYIVDAGNNCIRRVDARSGTIATWMSAADLMAAVASLQGS